MAKDPAVKPMTIAVGLMVLLAMAVGAWAMLRMDVRGERKTVADLPPVDPALIAYEQTAEYPTGLPSVSAMAVRPHGMIYVGGSKAIIFMCRLGMLNNHRIELSAEPTCLAFGPKEHKFRDRLYVGLGDHVAVFDPDGKNLATWPTPAQGAIFTSIAVGEEDVFVADAGNRTVWRYGLDGKAINRIGDPDRKRKIPGFVITNEAYFDLALGTDGLLHVVNPRALRIEAYTFAGDLEGSWGKSSPQIDGFFGCCNPAHIAVLPDGRYVTAEKGIGRIKVYSPEGKFESVVAGPKEMSETAADVAVDGEGRILILDAKSRSIRVFERKKGNSGVQP